MLYVKGEYDKALEYCEKALETQKAFFGENHPNTATTYGYIGDIRFEQGDYQAALENHNKALEIKEAIYGPEDSRTINTKNKVSEIQTKLKEQEIQPNE